MTRRPSRRWLIPLFIVLALAAIYALRVGVLISRVQSDARALQALTEKGSLALGFDLASSEVSPLIGQAARDFHDLRAALGPFVYIGPLLGWLPRYGGDLANAPSLVAFGEQATESAQETLALAKALNTVVAEGNTAGTPVGVVLLQATRVHRAAIETAQRDLAAAEQTRAHVNAAELSPSLRGMLARLDRYLPVWKTALDTLALAPTLLGEDRARVYLLIAQNSDELRATGGFVSGVALLRIEQGNITVGDFQDSFVVDDMTRPHPAPPEPLAKYMLAGAWVFRDANWSPDFPTSARHLEELYKLDRDIAADGVIAVNLRVMPRLFKAIGPITLEASGERIDATNVVSKLQANWGQAQPDNAGWWSHRKDFMGTLFQTLMQRVMAGEISRTELAGALFDATLTKDLLIYLNDGAAIDEGSLLHSGSLYRGAGDVLMLVDSNVGWNKVDVNVERQIDYTVQLDDPAGPRARVAVTYTNLTPDTQTFCAHVPHYMANYAELQQGCYWDYIRIVAPAGSQFIQATRELGAKTELDEAGRTVFSGYMVLATGQKSTVYWEYRLPGKLDSQSGYRLYLERQPGAPEIPVAVHVVLPEGLQPSSTSPAPVRRSGNTIDFALSLDRDQQIAVTFGQGISPTWVVPLLGCVGLVVLALLGYRRIRRRARSGVAR